MESSKRRRIPFNVPTLLGTEQAEVRQAIDSRQLSGNGTHSKQCASLLEAAVGCERAILTPSCTAALEMCALIGEIGPGDEVIMPSFTFVSTANAFALRGAKIVWCDIRQDTKNIDEALLEPLITARTRAVVVTHYGGVGCEMDLIGELCRSRGILLIEDAAQSIGCRHRGAPLGSLSDLATLSFHDTKNLHCGEGGALLVNNPSLVDRAEVVRDKGTDRTRFLEGVVDKYTWTALGSSYLMSELQAAFLLAQLRELDAVTSRRLLLWERYRAGLDGSLPAAMLPRVPDHCEHNGHLFPVVASSLAAREAMTAFLRERGVQAYFHYLPLHKAPFWHGRYDSVKLAVTESVAESLLRLPLYHELAVEDVDYVCDCLIEHVAAQGG